MTQRILLLITFLLWFSSALYLAHWAPRVHDVTYNGSRILPKQSLAILEQATESLVESDVITSTKQVVLNLQTGQIRELIDEPFAFLLHYGDDGTVHFLVSRTQASKLDPDAPDSIFWAVIDLNSGDQLKAVPYRFANFEDRFVVEDRFLITMRKTHLEVIDLNSADPSPQRSDMSAKGWSSVIDHSNKFLIFRKGRQSYLYLYEVLDSGRIENLSSWEVRRSPAEDYFSTTNTKNEIASVAVDENKIEIRSVNDGEITQTITLPKNWDLKKSSWRISDRIFGYNTGKELFLIDWKTGTQFDVIQSSDMHWTVEGNLVRYYANEHRNVLDISTGKLIGKIKTKDVLDSVDNEYAWISDHRWGWSIRKFDLKSGQVVASWHPYRHVMTLYLFVTIGFFLWLFVWLKTSVAKKSPAWIDSVLIGLPVFLALTYRAVFVGQSLEASRHVYHFAQGAAMAGATIAMVWLVFGKTRFTLRLLPLIAVCAAVTFALAAAFAQQQQTAWHALVSAFVPVVIFGILLIPARWIGISIFQFRSSDGHDVTERTTKFPIRDLFVLTLVTSAGFAGIRMISGGFDGVIDVRFLVAPLIIYLALAISGLIFGLTNSRSLYLLGCVLAELCIVYLTLDPALRFMGDRWYDAAPWFPTHYVARVLITFVAGLYLMLWPWRLRGWRIGRNLQAT